MNWCAMLLSFCAAPGPVITPGQHGQLTRPVQIEATCVDFKDGSVTQVQGRYGPFGFISTRGSFTDFTVLAVSPEGTPEDDAIVTIEATDFNKNEGQSCEITIDKTAFVLSTKLDPPAAK